MQDEKLKFNFIVEMQQCKESDFFDSGQMTSDDLGGHTHTLTHGRLYNDSESALMSV